MSEEVHLSASLFLELQTIKINLSCGFLFREVGIQLLRQE